MTTAPRPLTTGSRRWHVMGYRSDRITDNFYFGPIEAPTAADAIRLAKQRPEWHAERIREAYASEIVERGERRVER